MFQSSNPALKPGTFTGWRNAGGLELGAAAARSKVMTISGAVNASLILTTICAAFAVLSFGWLAGNPKMALPILLGGGLLGFIMAMVMSFKPSAATFAAPAYALAEGVFVGGVSQVYAVSAAGTKLGGVAGTGIVFQAILLTFGVLFAMLGLYKFRVVRATPMFYKGMMIAVGAICLFGIVSLVMSLAGVNMAWRFDGGPISLGISAIIIVVAAAKLIIDFDQIEQGAASGAPKYMEWYSGFALLVTIVWLYLEVLRLLSMLSRRN